MWLYEIGYGCLIGRDAGKSRWIDVYSDLHVGNNRMRLQSTSGKGEIMRGPGILFPKSMVGSGGWLVLGEQEI
jgi:hypothetical protein